MFNSFTNEELIAMEAVAYDNAVNCPREGPGTGRASGSCGRVTNEWVIIRTELKRRGLLG